MKRREEEIVTRIWWPINIGHERVFECVIVGVTLFDCL